MINDLKMDDSVSFGYHSEDIFRMTFKFWYIKLHLHFLIFSEFVRCALGPMFGTRCGESRKSGPLTPAHCPSLVLASSCYSATKTQSVLTGAPRIRNQS